MSAEENKEFIRRMVEKFHQEAAKGNKITEAMLREYIDDETLIEHALASRESFPSYWMDYEELIAEGDLVSARGWFRGVHLGHFMHIPPTGREVKVSTFVTYRIIGGKIVDHWMMMDSASLLDQLGVNQLQGRQISETGAA